MQTILLADLPAQPWRNGAGVTRLIASGRAGPGVANANAPADGEEFDWRLSLADIREDGPFSVFPGIDRCAVLLGDGRIMLTGATDSRYLSPLQPLSFAGEAQWHARCDLNTSMPRILNLMVRRNTMRSGVCVVNAAQRLPAAATLFVLVASGQWEFAPADQAPATALAVGVAGIAHALAAGAVMRPCAPGSEAIIVVLQEFA